jgi:hypothetical protein
MVDNTYSMVDNTYSMVDNTSSMVDNEQIKEVLSCLKKRMAYEDLAKLICSLCSIKPMSKKEVSNLLRKNERYILTILTRMTQNKLLRYSENMQKHPDQAYITNKQKSSK